MSLPCLPVSQALPGEADLRVGLEASWQWKRKLICR